MDRCLFVSATVVLLLLAINNRGSVVDAHPTFQEGEATSNVTSTPSSTRTSLLLGQEKSSDACLANCGQTGCSHCNTQSTGITCTVTCSGYSCSCTKILGEFRCSYRGPTDGTYVCTEPAKKKPNKPATKKPIDVPDIPIPDVDCTIENGSVVCGGKKIVCFPHYSTVQMEDGRRVSMFDLQIGDRVLSVDPSTGRQFIDEVVTFLHREMNDDNDKTTYIRLSLVNGASITLTPLHMIYFVKASEVAKRGSSALLEKAKPKFALRVQPGDYLIHSDGKAGQFELVQVAEISFEYNNAGKFAPMTMSGNIVVDGTVASCYAQYEWHHLAHISMAPLRAVNTIGKYFSNIWPSSLYYDSDNTISTGIHPYAEFLYNTVKSFMASTSFRVLGN